MRALTMKARTVLAASVCILALLFLVPAAANAQVVTVKHIRVTLSPFSGANVTAIYCDNQTTCTGGIQVWTFPAGNVGIPLSGGQTLVLTQTATTSNSTPPFTITGAPNAGNFDTSDRVRPTAPQLQDCSPTNKCRTKVEVDTGAGFVTAWDDNGVGDALSKFNTDLESDGTTQCEGAAYTTRYTAPAGNFSLGTGYADNVHTPSCNFLPTPWQGTATVFLGAGVGAEGHCTSNCYDAGAIVITGISQGCTLTQGFWKNHGLNAPGNQENVWPVNHLTLGTVNYTQLQLQSILDTAPKGNGLITLAHQLIAAKLNIANGANGSSIASTIAAADALIGSKVVPPVGNGFLDPSAVSALVDALDDFNSGITGPGHCDDSSETD